MDRSDAGLAVPSTRGMALKHIGAAIPHAKARHLAVPSTRGMALKRGDQQRTSGLCSSCSPLHTGHGPETITHEPVRKQVNVTCSPLHTGHGPETLSPAV